MIHRNYEELRAYALSVLEAVDFSRSPQLNVAMRDAIDAISEQLAERAINLEWEEWA